MGYRFVVMALFYAGLLLVYGDGVKDGNLGSVACFYSSADEYGMGGVAVTGILQRSTFSKP